MIAHAQRAAWIHLVFPSILGRMTSTPTTTAKVRLASRSRHSGGVESSATLRGAP